MIMMSSEVLMCFFVFLSTENIWFGEKNQVYISNIEEDNITLLIIPGRAQGGGGEVGRQRGPDAPLELHILKKIQ